MCAAARVPHACLPLQVTVEFGGSAEHTILVMVMRCISDSLALMVTDAKGRIGFATSNLATMLGYNVRSLSDGGMNLNALLPLPYSQLHAGYMKVRGGHAAPCCPAGTRALTNARLPSGCLPPSRRACNMHTTRSTGRTLAHGTQVALTV